jgi:hypothetical protein
MTAVVCCVYGVNMCACREATSLAVVVTADVAWYTHRTSLNGR